MYSDDIWNLVVTSKSNNSSKSNTIPSEEIINRLKEMCIENAYINSYDWRKKVYNSAGFETEDSIGFWHKKIR